MDAAASEASSDLAAVDFGSASQAVPTTRDAAGGSDSAAETDAPRDLNLALQLTRDGVDSGFIQVYRAVQPGLLRYLRTFVGDEADDVASDTWAQVCRDLPRFAGDFGRFRGWVTRIGRNRAIDHLRAQGRRPVVSMPAEDLHQVVGNANTEAEANETMSTEAAIRLICSLPPDQAEAVLIRVVVGVDAKTAGSVLGKSAGAVRTLTYRGLKSLAARLDETR